MYFDPVFVWNLSLLNLRKWNQIVDTVNNLLKFTHDLQMHQESRFPPIEHHHILFILLVQYIYTFCMFLVRPSWVY